MANINKYQPVIISLGNGFLQTIAGVFEKAGFKVQSLAVAGLPLDVFKNGAIVQPELVGKMILTLMAGSKPKKITHNFVVISLPDELVFSKYLLLPKVDLKELESSVYFKIKDYLPHPADKMYLDWQPLKDGNGEIEVNVVAVKRSIIDSFFQVFQKINLFPVCFEPESCSLARLAGFSTSEPNLIIYFREDKAILCFSQKGIVLLTTTVSFSPDQDSCSLMKDELIKSVKYWQNNFGKKQIKKVYLAGDFDNELLCRQVIKDNLGIDAEKLALPVILPGSLPAKNLTRLIPLFGLAFFHRQPLGTKKITLIPAEVKNQREAFKFHHEVANVLRLTSFVLCGFLAGFMFMFLSLFFQLEQTKAALSGWEKTVFTENQTALEKKAISFNEKLASLEQVLKKRQPVAVAMKAFIQKVPAGITIKEFIYSPGQNTIEIQGIASSRDNILTLEKSLTDLGKVSIPLSSFETVLQPVFQASVKLK